MPYSGADDPKLPDHIKKLGKKARRTWIAAFNNAYKRKKDDEGYAFRVANAAVKGMRESLGENYDWASDDMGRLYMVDGIEPPPSPPSISAQPVEPVTESTPTLQRPPTMIRAMLPEDARSVWLETYNLCAVLGGDHWQCEDAAWRAVDEAGYVPESTPKYVKVAESTDLEPAMFHEAEGSIGGSVWEVVLIKAGMSANGRRYTEEVLRQAAPLFEGVKAYADHATQADLVNRKGNRSVTEVVGWYTEARYDPQLHAVIANMHVLESAQWLRSLLMDMTNHGAPNLIGLSINAMGEEKVVREGGQYLKEVTTIKSVGSVDVVTEPAAGGSVVRLVANKNEEDNIMNPEELKKLLESMNEEDRAAFLKSAGLEAPAAVAVQDPPPDPKPNPPNPEPNPPNPDPSGPTIIEMINPLTEQVNNLQKELRLNSVRAYTATKLTESRLPTIVKDKLKTRIDSLLERREAGQDEIDAMFTEAQDIWAAFEQSNGSGRVRIGDGAGSPPSISNGAASQDQFIAALDGMFINQDVELDGKKVKRFGSLREAYCQWNGVSPFQVNPEEMFESYRSRYDSARQGVKFEEAMTTASWGELFSDRMYRRMIAEYRIPALDEWRKLVSNIENVPDFRAQRRDRLGGYGLLETVGESETYPLLESPTDEEVSYTVEKRGGIDTITFEMIVNDDLRNIRTIPTKLARAAKHTLFRFVMNTVKDFSTAIYDGVALYHANHNNLITEELSTSSLETLWQAMRAQQSFGQDDIEFLGLRPKYLLVPPELEQHAWRLANSAVAILSANFNATEPNYFQNKMEVIVVDYWTDPNDWFLVADPNLVPTIEIGFLHGQEEPELFVQDQPTIGSVFTSDKISYKIRHIYSGTVLDWRGVAGSQVA